MAKKLFEKERNGKYDPQLEEVEGVQPKFPEEKMPPDWYLKHAINNFSRVIDLDNHHVEASYIGLLEAYMIAGAKE